MKKRILFTFCCFALKIALCQPDSGKVVLGIAPFGKTADINDKYPSLVSGVIAEQASNIAGLNYVSRSQQVLEQIAKEKSINTGADWLNSENLAEVGKRLGATYLLTGEISQISVQKTPIGYKKVLGMQVPITGKFVTVIVNLNIVNVTSGTTVTKQISSSSLPSVGLGGDEKMIASKIGDMDKPFREFLESWYTNKQIASNK